MQSKFSKGFLFAVCFMFLMLISLHITTVCHGDEIIGIEVSKSSSKIIDFLKYIVLEKKYLSIFRKNISTPSSAIVLENFCLYLLNIIYQFPIDNIFNFKKN